LNRPSIHPEPPLHNGQDERWALISRVAASRQFARAPQLREILLYLVQRVLADPTATIKEHDIGCNVLGRKADFNPHEDNIVRVQVSHLRKRLEEFFGSEGKDEPLQVIIPKGSYAPRFQPKPEPAPPPPVHPRIKAVIAFLSAGLFILAALCLSLVLRPGSAGPSASLARPAAQDPFWSRLFGSNAPVGIVVSDSCLVLLQDVLHTDLTVDNYVDGQYPGTWLQGVKDSELKSALQLLSERQYTSLADLTLSTKLMELSRRFGPKQAAIHYARHLNIRDFKTGSFILLGSRRGVPWVRLFDQQLNFAMEEDKKTHRFYFRNKSPGPGEQAVYSQTPQDGVLESYADIAFLPNLANTGSVLLLSGIAMVDTEAAGEFLTGNEPWKRLTQVLGPGTARDGYFEILLKSRGVAGSAGTAQVVAHRIFQPGASNHLGN